MNKVIRDGKVAVLISPGYGAGWSTWMDNCKELAAFDSRIVNYMLDTLNVHSVSELYDLEQLTEFNKFVQSLPEYQLEYLGGLENICIEWVPEGTKFLIEEYDGNEDLVYLDQLPILQA